jgi:hypothetical protein
MGVLFTTNAYAYIDLGSGSFILQLVIASFFGIVFTAKSYIKQFFVKIQQCFSSKKSTPNPKAPNTSDQNK